ncbi:MAG: septal ring lytic transglycosylase RlpA family protein [Propionibacteriaceae bacterium]
MRGVVPAAAGFVVLVSGMGVYGIADAYASDVIVSVDGQQTRVRTYATTVGEALNTRHITLSEHDSVAPSLMSKVTDGTQISVRYGRPVTVTIDGVASTKWVTATTVDDALAEFGVGGSVRISTSRTSSISRDGASIDVTTPSGVSVAADGVTRGVLAYGIVADALATAGITLGPLDEVTPAVTTSVAAGTAITVVRVELRTVTRNVDVAYTTTTQQDPTLTAGTTKVVSPGVKGASAETWMQRVRDGVVTQEVRVTSVLTIQVQAEVVAVGTKPTATATPTKSTATAAKTTSAPAATKTTTTAPPTTVVPTPTATSGANTCGASYYQSGTTTANGEAFNPDGLTAAHKTLPFNTKVKVTNLANGKSVTVRINDRGPYVTGRCIDLARGAFSQIASLSSGVITVSWQIV